MKTTIKSIIGILLVTLLAACQIGDGEMGKTKKGKQIFDYWSIDMKNLFNMIVQPALCFNQYLIAPEEEKEQVFSRLFSQNDSIVQVRDNYWAIINTSGAEEVYFTLMQGSTSLESEGSILKIVRVGRNCPSSIRGRNFLLINEGNGKWLLTESNVDTYLELDFNHLESPVLLSEEQFSISGTGLFMHENATNNATYVYLDYSITKPMQVDGQNLDYWSWAFSSRRPLYWLAGQVTITARNTTDQCNTVDALIIEPGLVSIEIDGIAQTWNQVSDEGLNIYPFAY